MNTRGTNGKTSPKTSQSSKVSDQEKVEGIINGQETGKSVSSGSTGKVSGKTAKDSGKSSKSEGKSSVKSTGKTTQKTSTAKQNGKTSSNGGKTSAKMSEEAPVSNSKELAIIPETYTDEASGDEIAEDITSEEFIASLLDRADELISHASECVKQASRMLKG